MMPGTCYWQRRSLRGKGYSLLNSPTPGILPLYPPAFPFVLSLVFRLAPSFPQNIYLLKAISIAAMLGAGWLTYRYFQRERGLPWFVALGIMLSSVLSPMLVFLATSSVMSRCFFTLIFISCGRIGRAQRAGETNSEKFAMGGAGWGSNSHRLLDPFDWLGADRGRLSLFAQREVAQVCSGFCRLGSGVISALGNLRAFARHPRQEQQREQGGHIVMPYTRQFWQRRAGFEFMGEVTTADLPARVVRNITEITGRDVLRIVAAPIFEALRDPAEEAKQERVRAGGSPSPLLASFVLSVLVILGFILVVRQKITMAELAVFFSLGITLLWPWETLRYVLPLIPFIVFYFLSGVRALYGWYQQKRQQPGLRAQWMVMAGVTAFIIAINLYGHASYLSKINSNSPLERPPWTQSFEELETMLKWIDRNVPKDAVLAAGLSTVSLLVYWQQNDCALQAEGELGQLESDGRALSSAGLALSRSRSIRQI
jgi:hypothetical protein